MKLVKVFAVEEKILVVVLICMVLFSLTSCGRNSESNKSNASSQVEKASEMENKTSGASGVSENSSADEHNISQGNSTKEAATEETMNTINIIVGGSTFVATLENNDTSKAFIKQLPLTVDMSELHGNEKYNYLSNNLPANTASCPEIINEGDLMLYGKNCLVIFYKTFNTSYSYVKLGHINNTTGLEKALGLGNVQIIFSVNT